MNSFFELSELNHIAYFILATRIFIQIIQTSLTNTFLSIIQPLKKKKTSRDDLCVFVNDERLFMLLRDMN